MQRKQRNLASFLGLCAVLALSTAIQTQADDKKADPSGTWTWTTPGRNGGPDRKMTLTIKVEADKVTGKLVSPGRDGQTSETVIEEATLKGEEISFKATREFNGNKFTAKYSGKLSGDTIKGKIETERNGETQSRDWEAKRDTEKKKAE